MSNGGKVGSGGKGPSRRRKLMSGDDEALWDLVASRIDPTRGKARVGDVDPNMVDHFPDPIGSEDRGPPVADPRPRPVSAKAPEKAQARAPRKPPPAPQPVVLERRQARRMARGADEIEARLDLHGMTQDDAHARLVDFIRRCHDNGLRTVLVITGKGAPTDRSGRDRGDDGDYGVARPRGVLRRNVPRWLAGAEIGALVVSYSTAHVRHGGEGALYVRLRRVR